MGSKVHGQQAALGSPSPSTPQAPQTRQGDVRQSHIRISRSPCTGWVDLMINPGSATAVGMLAASVGFCGLGRVHLRPEAARATVRAGVAPPTWEELEARLPSATAPEPPVIDSVLSSSEPVLDGLVLFRERHGWCPYSERVWLALEYKGLGYTSILIDNTGGGRPSWYGGSTPQVRWPDGRQQGESMDLVRRLDEEYPDSPQLWPPPGMAAADVTEMVVAWKSAFPRSARPSSRLGWPAAGARCF